MAERPTLSPDLTDVIVARGDRNVVRRTAGNAGANFSPDGYSTLIKRAGQDGVLTIRLGQREDLSPDQLKDLLSGSIDVVRRRLLTVVTPERQAGIKQAMSAITGVTRTGGAPRLHGGAAHGAGAAPRRRARRGRIAQLRQGFQIRGVGRRAFGDERREDRNPRSPDQRRPLRSDPGRRQDHRPRMGDRACADHASARSEPDRCPGRHRNRAGELRPPDAIDRRARRELLEDPPVGLDGRNRKLLPNPENGALSFAPKTRNSVGYNFGSARC